MATPGQAHSSHVEKANAYQSATVERGRARLLRPAAAPASCEVVLPANTDVTLLLQRNVSLRSAAP